MIKIENINGRFDREFNNKGNIVYTKCDSCGNDKGQWTDEVNCPTYHEIEGVYCTQCAKAIIEAEEHRYTLYNNILTKITD